MSGLREKRAETLYLWYRSQPSHATALRDHEIAERLDAVAPGEGWVHGGRGDAAAVRATRRYIDRQTTGDLAVVAFGTKRAGRGRTYSHMFDGEAAQVLDATIGSVSQIESTEHWTKAEAERRARESMKYEAASHKWFDLRDFDKSMACKACANDVQTYGYLTSATKSQLVLAGLTPL